ncbi:unnamed protein product, partial [Scytosiphon promiscuus]
AVKWNADCDRILEGAAAWSPVYRNTAKQLQEYYTVYQNRANVALTMYSINDTAQELRSELQRPVGGAAFESSVAQVQPVPVDFRRVPAAGGLLARGG